MTKQKTKKKQSKTIKKIMTPKEESPPLSSPSPPPNKKVIVPSINELCIIFLKKKPSHKLIDLELIKKYHKMCRQKLQKYSDEELNEIREKIEKINIDNKKLLILDNIFMNLNSDQNKNKYNHINFKLKEVKSNPVSQHKCLSSYTFIKELGQGGFGKTYLVEKNKKEYAVKEITTKNFFMSKKEMIHKNKKEIQTAIKMGKLNIGPKIYDSYICKDKGEVKMFLVMEHMTEGTLKEWLTSNTLTSDYKKQILKKIKKMHSLNYYHVDTHLENIFVTKNKNKIEFYIGDFGQSYSGLDDIKQILSNNDMNMLQNSLRYNMTEKYNELISKLFIAWNLV